MTSTLLVFVALIGYVYGEMCLLLPYQRGGLVPSDQLNSNEAGAPACDVRNTYNNGTNAGSPPCYGRSNDDERIDQFIGRNAEQVMVAQKLNGTKDWYNASNPGNFSFTLYSWNGGDMKKVAFLNSTKDTNSDKEFYQVTVHIPGNIDQDEHYVVQAVYYTNTIQNGTEINFYQCSDVLAV